MAEYFDMSRSTILVLDPEPLLTQTLVSVLNRFPQEFVAIGSTSLAGARKLLNGFCPDLVLAAAIWPGANGLEHASEIRDTLGCKVLLISAYPNAGDALEEVKKQGHEPFEILAKPVPPEELLAKIRQMLRNQAP